MRRGESPAVLLLRKPQKPHGELRSRGGSAASASLAVSSAFWP
jgi:hypothetical protein